MRRMDKLSTDKAFALSVVKAVYTFFTFPFDLLFNQKFSLIRVFLFDLIDDILRNSLAVLNNEYTQDAQYKSYRAVIEQ